MKSEKASRLHCEDLLNARPRNKVCPGESGTLCWLGDMGRPGVKI